MQANNKTDIASNGALSVERSIVELRRGRDVEVIDSHAMANDSTNSVLVTALDRLEASRLVDFANEQGQFQLLISRERAQALGLTVTADAIAITVSADASLGLLARLAGMGSADAGADVAFEFANLPTQVASAALLLARQAAVLPALLFRHVSTPIANSHHLRVCATDIETYPNMRGQLLQRVSSAPVQLDSHEHCEFIVFRERFGDAEHVAIVVGEPDTAKPVLVRLHSACLTGDLLGSLRCDCGEQLRGAVARIAEAGGGVVLYLDQEGRGIGLANKLRAYQLQDNGLDTIDANQHLGFLADERTYTAASAMLTALGITRLQLLTNNPAKVEALHDSGIEVAGRIPMPATVNPHNARYLQTKCDRAGHLGLDINAVEADCANHPSMEVKAVEAK